MSHVNEFKHGASNAQVEVDKLKQLVKKLEKQNQHLRKKSGKLSPSPRSGGDGILFTKPNGDNTYHSPEVSKSTHGKGWFSSEKNILGSLIESKVEESDESSWLYELPVDNIVLNQQPITPEKWLKSELENPSTPQLKAAKEDILTQLNPPYTGPVFSNYSTPVKVITTGKFPLYTEIDKKEENLARNPSIYSDDEPTNNTNIINRGLDKVDSPNEDNYYTNSSPVSKNTSPVHAHHMPLPSHTRTTRHGLSPSRPSSTSRCRSPSPNLRAGSQVKTRRSASFDRNEQRRSESPKVSPLPQSLPAAPRGRTASPKPNINYGLTKDINNKSNLMRFKPNTQSTNEIKSKLSTPRQIRQPSKLAAPSSGGSYELIKNNNANAGNRSITPRRSLPRPSQTSTKNQFMHKRTSTTRSDSGSASPKLLTTNRIGSNGTNSPRGSDAGSDVVWSEGEFF